MSLLWKIASGLADLDDDAYLGLDHSKHENHSPHPLLASAGFGHSPCTSVGCSEYDEDHDKALDRAYDSKGSFKLIDSANAGLHGYESRINEDTVTAYRAATPPKKTMPKVFTHKGKTHILDGHHRLIADALEGRTTPVLHTNLDEGGQ